MEIDIKLRKVTQDVLLFVWSKNGIVTIIEDFIEFFLPEIPAELVKNLQLSVWLESCYILPWESFVKNHFERMTSSVNKFTVYVFYIFEILNTHADAFKCFFDILSFVTYIGVYCWNREHKRFINVCAELFCIYFEKYIRSKFENLGGWQNFNEYLEKLEILIGYKSALKDNKNPLEDINSLLTKPGPSRELCIQINGVFINLLSFRTVESNEMAISFAKLVENTISELYKKKQLDILTDFTTIDLNVRAMYRQTVDETSYSVAREVENSSFPKLQKLENILTACHLEKKVQQSQEFFVSDSVETKSLDKSNSQDVNESAKPLHSLRPRQLERAKNVLKDITMDVNKLTDIIRSLCKEYGVQVLKPVESNGKEKTTEL